MTSSFQYGVCNGEPIHPPTIQVSSLKGTPVNTDHPLIIAEDKGQLFITVYKTIITLKTSYLTPPHKTCTELYFNNKCAIKC